MSKANSMDYKTWGKESAENTWRCTVRIPIEEKDKILEHIKKQGLTVSEYLRNLIEMDMED